MYIHMYLAFLIILLSLYFLFIKSLKRGREVEAFFLLFPSSFLILSSPFPLSSYFSPILGSPTNSTSLSTYGIILQSQRRRQRMHMHMRGELILKRLISCVFYYQIFNQHFGRHLHYKSTEL